MDRQFVSFPKSGRTWIRYILSQLNCDQLVHFHHDRFEFSDGCKPPHCFSTLDRLVCYAETEKLIYMDRDPRDVMVSLFHQITGRFGNVFEYRGNLSEFLRDDYFGAENLKRFRDMWAIIVGDRGFFRVSYEDCHLNVTSVLRQILRYYEIEVSQAQLTDAIGRGSLANMKKIEASMQFPEPWLRYRNNSPKVRQGAVGAFREVLDPADILFLNEVFGL